MNDASPAVKPLSLTDEETQKAAVGQVKYQMPKEQAKQMLCELVASGGLVLNEDGEIQKMSIKKFAEVIGWGERTMYDWIDADPNWNAKVFQAIKRVHGAKRVARVLRGVFTQASLGKDKQADLYLRHFWPDYIDPKAVVSHEVKGFTDLLRAASEGEIIDADYGNDAEPSGADPAALPSGS